MAHANGRWVLIKAVAEGCVREPTLPLLQQKNIHDVSVQAIPDFPDYFLMW